jgi:S-adenosylmethionine hydrolase
VIQPLREAPAPQPAPPCITLLTDFGTRDTFVGVMKGVIFGICPQARVMDLTHAVPPGQIMAGALALRGAVAFFPAGTIHVAVVDPGVGSARRPIIVETEHGVLVGPDNGLLGPAAAASGRRALRLIENQALLRHPVSQTFHARDIFAPVAAHLARGVAPQAVGRRLDTMVELAIPVPSRTPSGLAGEVVYVDHFGNLVTNIDAEAIGRFPAPAVSVSIEATRVVGPVTAYAAVPEGALLAIIGSWGLMEVAVRNGNAAQVLAAGPGTPVTVVWEQRDA